MLHSLRPLQDENNQPYIPGKRSGADATKRFGGLSSSTPAGKHAGLGSARKALGNITNKAANSQQLDATPFKTTPSVPGARKTLGDITNTTPAGLRKLAEPTLQKHAQKSSVAKPKAAKPKSQAEIYAVDGIEQLAGKSMQQLQEDREQRDLMDAKQKAAHIASLPAMRIPVLPWSMVSDISESLATCLPGMTALSIHLNRQLENAPSCLPTSATVLCILD